MGSLAYQDDMWDEMLNGRLVAMSPRPAVSHNIVGFNIARILGNFLHGKPCIAFADGTDVFLTEKDRVVPDVMVVCNKDIIKTNGIHGTPDLVVEVLSHGTAKNDKGYKKDLYERCGVREYWIVDVSNRFIEVYHLKENVFVLDDVYSVFPDYVIEDMTEEEKSSIIYSFKTSLFPDLTITIEDVFENVL